MKKPTKTNATRLIAVLAAAGMTLTAGCATITRSSSQTVTFKTTPSGASVKTSHGHYCPSTPCGIRMKRNKEFIATLEKEGCETAQATVSYGMQGEGTAMMAGNIVFGGIIGAGVDAMSGANMSLKPNPVEVNLDCG